MKAKKRWILLEGDIQIGFFPSIEELSQQLGCTKQWIYWNLKKNGDGTFNFQGKNYQLVDRCL